MKLPIIPIGNSLGIRIPKALLLQCGLKDQVIITVRDGSLVISPDVSHPRAGWAEEFKALHEAGEDELIDPELVTLESDKDEWEW